MLLGRNKRNGSILSYVSHGSSPYSRENEENFEIKHIKRDLDSMRVAKHNQQII